jgi:hypothetical protein
MVLPIMEYQRTKQRDVRTGLVGKSTQRCGDQSPTGEITAEEIGNLVASLVFEFRVLRLDRLASHGERGRAGRQGNSAEGFGRDLTTFAKAIPPQVIQLRAGKEIQLREFFAYRNQGNTEFQNGKVFVAKQESRGDVELIRLGQ